jgi:hypothetical protein
MQRLFFASVSSLAVLGIAMVAPAQAAPVAIHSCSVTQWQRVHARPYWNPWGPVRYNAPVVDGIRISYVNTSHRTADRVAFLVNYRGDVQHIIDTGTFSPNVTISHGFGNFSGDAYIGARPNSCVVHAVRYTDGTTWHSGR